MMTVRFGQERGAQEDSGLNVVIQWISLISSARVAAAKISRPNYRSRRHPIDAERTKR